ncbi:DUF3299 domain-containing protein [Gemmatimonas aurantiaca]|nr:DUF3299 domain-containing protein [Gemmatimonas aurantiaca]
MPRLRLLPSLSILIAAAMCGVRPSPVPDTVEASRDALPVTAPTVSGAADEVVTIDWRLLRTLDLRTGVPGDSLRRLVGRRVRLPGFIVPLEDFQDRAKEFLLVPYFGACVHMPPPPPNQLVYVKMRGTVNLTWWAPVWVEGVLRVITFQSPYGSAGFQMDADRIVPFRERQADASGRGRVSQPSIRATTPQATQAATTVSLR